MLSKDGDYNVDTKESVNVMDVAAEAAKKDFPEVGTVVDLSKWYEKHFLKAGYKRLGKIIVAKAKEIKAKNG